jgi:hypothetical protein
LVITSIVVHGSSIAVFTLGKHINTLTLTMSYTQANEEGPSWMERLPRIQSRSMSKSSMSFARSDTEIDEKEKALSPHNLQPGTFLRRQKEEDMPHGRTASRHRSRRSRNMGVGGPISQSAIHPERREESGISSSRSDSDTLAAKGDTPPSSDKENAAEIYEEGSNTVYEDAEGNVLAVEPTVKGETPLERAESEMQEGKRLMEQESANQNDGVAPTLDDPKHDTADRLKADAEKIGEKVTGKTQEPAKPQRRGLNTMGTLNKITTLAGMKKKDVAEGEEKPKAEKKRAQGPARAYQYGNTIIVEDEDGEVIKKYDIGPSANKQDGCAGENTEHTKQSIGRMGKMLGLNRGEGKAPVQGDAAGPSTGADGPKRPQPERKRTFRANSKDDDDNDDLVRFTMSSGGRRMSKAEFIDSIKKMDPKSRVQAVENSDVPEAVKREARKDAREHAALQHGGSHRAGVPVVAEQPEAEARGAMQDDYFNRDKKGRAAPAPGMIKHTSPSDDHDTKLKLVDSNDQEVPVHDVSASVRGRNGKPETAAERRRRAAAQAAREQDEDSEDDGTERVPPKPTGSSSTQGNFNDGAETAAEKRRRQGALGVRDESDSEEEGPLSPASAQNVQRQSTLKWGKNVKG